MDLNKLVDKPLDGLTNDEALEHIGVLIDAAGDAGSASGTDRAFLLLGELRKRDLSPEHAMLTHYFAANIWEARRRLAGESSVWSWEQPHVQEEILELRRAMRHEAFGPAHPLRQCQVLTNLANQLSHIGRFVEARELLDRVLGIRKNFAMALGNRGIVLGTYAQALYDAGHAHLMMVAAHDCLAAALSPGAVYDSDVQQAARAAFARNMAEIEARVDVRKVRQTIDVNDHGLGRGAAERAYRRWCLEQCLFVNPLNDLGPLPIAGRDILTLPSLTVSRHSAKPPPVFGFFNQMKQEFVSAR